MKSRAGYIVAVIGTLVFACFCCAPFASLATLEAVHHLRSRREPVQPTVAPEELLLPAEALPNGWRADRYAISERQRLKLFRGASFAKSRRYGFPLPERGSWVRHTVAWYRTEALARRNYRDLKNPSFSEWKSWEDLSGWAYISPHADEQNLVCVQENVSGTIMAYRCYFVARYGQYLSYFNVMLLIEHADPDEVKEWIVIVDELFADVEY